MGNKCSNNKQGFCINCFGPSKKSSKKLKHAADVLPEDLHASSRQKNLKDENRSSPPSRPISLEVHAINQKEQDSKFPDFSLHGIQKTSPSNTQENSPVNGESPDSIDLKQIEILYENYKDPSSEEDAILADGVERFCLDLEVDPAEFVVLALAWKFKAETMCKFTRSEFVEGFRNLRCESIEHLKSSFKKIESDALENFKDLYRYTFQFALDSEQGQRSLPCQIAVAMWNVVFSRNTPALLEPWLLYLEEQQIKGISRDTWNMFLYLIESLNDDFSNYNDNEAWPSLFDDFVDYQKKVLSNQEQSSNQVEQSTIQNEQSTNHDEQSTNQDEQSTNQDIVENVSTPDAHNPESKGSFSVLIETVEESIDNDTNQNNDYTKASIPGTIASSTESDLQIETDEPTKDVDNVKLSEQSGDADVVSKLDISNPNQSELLAHLHADAPSVND